MSILEKRFVWRRDEKDRKRLPHKLSQLQRDNVRRALRSLRMKHGMSGLAGRMGLTYDGMRKTLKRAPTMRAAVLVAFVAGVSIESVLAGAWPCVCPHCGRSD